MRRPHRGKVDRVCAARRAPSASSAARKEGKPVRRCHACGTERPDHWDIAMSMKKLPHGNGPTRTAMLALRTEYLACLSIHLRWQGIILRGIFPRSPGARIAPQVPMRTDLVEYEQAYR